MGLTDQQTGRNSDSARPGRRQPNDTRAGAAKGSALAKMPPSKTWLWFLGILLANYLLMRFLMPSPEAPVTVPYTLFKEEVGKGNVEAIYSQGESITGRFKTPVTYPPTAEKTALPSEVPQTVDKKDAAPSAEPQKRLSALPPRAPRPKHRATSLLHCPPS
jgi:FtsH Extracellular